MKLSMNSAVLKEEGTGWDDGEGRKRLNVGWSRNYKEGSEVLVEGKYEHDSAMWRKQRTWSNFDS